jgi:acetylornithine deacetylase/succinyl-diaminopimelate desuccinylase-like protein
VADVAADSGHVDQAAAAAVAFARTQRPRHVQELLRLVRFPSVSAQPRHAPDVIRCGEAFAANLQRIGFENVQLLPTKRHPFVYGDWLHAPGGPTLIVYGHFDVQPAEPLARWRSPPFQPVVRDGNVLGRGVCDDKGQLLTHLNAFEAYMRTARRLPVNVRCVLDGEEEIGSPGLRAHLARDPGVFSAEVAVMSDTRMLGPDRPALTYSLRGSLSVELEVRGPPRDLHSGNFGGGVANPLEALARALASLHRRDGRVAIEGFYDSVRRVSPEERKRMARRGPSDLEILHAAGVTSGWGEPNHSTYERTTIRPALTVNGITGGYAGPGGKAIIPARASAKLNLRLVPDQDPAEIEALLRRHLERVVPAGVSLSVQRHAAARPALIDRAHPAMRAAAHAYRSGFGVAPTFVRSGGTIPLVSALAERLGISTVLMGFALPDDRIHAPNEKFALANLYRGTETCIWFLAELAKLRSATSERTARRRVARSRLAKNGRGSP